MFGTTFPEGKACHAGESGTSYESECTANASQTLPPITGCVHASYNHLPPEDVHPDSNSCNIGAVNLQRMRSTQLHQIEEESYHKQKEDIRHKAQAFSLASALIDLTISKLFCHRSRCSHHVASRACILPLLDNLWQTPFSAPGILIHCMRTNTLRIESCPLTMLDRHMRVCFPSLWCAKPSAWL